MKSVSYSTSLKTPWKIVLYLCAAFLAVISADLVSGILFGYTILVENINEDAQYWVVVFFTLVFMGSIASIYYTHYFEVKVDESGISKKGLLNSFHLSYDEIEEIFTDIMIVSFKGNGKAISLGNLYTDFEEPMEYISTQLSGRKDIHFRGKSKRVKRFFPWAPDE